MQEFEGKERVIFYLSRSKKLRYESIKYVLLDDQLYYKTVEGVLLKCLSHEEAKKVMSEVH